MKRLKRLREVEMKLNKNLIQCIARQSDDRTILNLLSIRKDLYDDDFFQIIFNERYPFLKQFKLEKSGEISWRNFYMNMIDRILKLKEEFDIDYIKESPEFNPADVYKTLKFIEEESGKENAILIYKEEFEPFFIGSTGNLKLVKEYLNNNSDFSIFRLYGGAFKSNQVDFIRYLSTKIGVPYEIIGEVIEMKNEKFIYDIESKILEGDLSENELEDMYSTAVLASIHINDFSLVKYFFDKLTTLNYDVDDFFIFLTGRIAQSSPEDKRIVDTIYEKLPDDYKKPFISSLIYNIVLEDNINNVPLLIHIYHNYFSGSNSKQHKSFIKSLLYESEGLEKMDVYNAFLNSLNSEK